MSNQTSVFTLVNDTKKLVSLINSRNRICSSYVYKGKSKNNVATIWVNKKMRLSDPYEIEICAIRYDSVFPIKISCNAVQIYNSIDNSNYAVIFSNDKSIDICTELLYDTKIPLPNPIVFIGNYDFEITIKLRDK